MHVGDSPMDISSLATFAWASKRGYDQFCCSRVGTSGDTELLDYLWEHGLKVDMDRISFVANLYGNTKVLDWLAKKGHKSNLRAGNRSHCDNDDETNNNGNDVTRINGGGDLNRKDSDNYN